MRTNQLLSSFGFIKGNVKRTLFNSFCMAVYGSQLWDYSINAPEAFYTAWRKCLRRIDGLPNKTHKIILPVLWDVKPIHVQLHKRFVNFVKKNAKTENEIIKICHNLTMQGSSSAVSNSVSHIYFLYNISRHNIYYNLTLLLTMLGGGTRVMVSTAAFHARVRGSVPGLGGLKETNNHIHVWKSVLWGASVTER